MELVEGANLEDALAQRTFNPREIGEIAYDIAEALEFVHANGVVHRDIKPSNILLVEYGTSTFRTRARLTDFGIALDAESARLTSDQATTGTAAYLSPEQAGRKEVTSADRRLLARPRAAAVLHGRARVPRRADRVGARPAGRGPGRSPTTSRSRGATSCAACSRAIPPIVRRSPS